MTQWTVYFLPLARSMHEIDDTSSNQSTSDLQSLTERNTRCQQFWFSPLKQNHCRFGEGIKRWESNYWSLPWKGCLGSGYGNCWVQPWKYQVLQGNYWWIRGIVVRWFNIRTELIIINYWYKLELTWSLQNFDDDVEISIEGILFHNSALWRKYKY